ncbi:MAG: C-type lectin domain-containing protein [Deltaproteobacteria bacterium]|nr:C-type lectin domain-containing protein [Deltaproteobacteria bacterium]
MAVTFLRTLGLAVLSTALAGCFVNRGDLASDGGAPVSPDASSTIDAPGLDAPLPPAVDAARLEEDAFVVEGSDAWVPTPIDAWAPPSPDAWSPPVCVPTGAEACNARDDDCDGRIDDMGCGGSVGSLSVACVPFVHAGHIYQLCKATGFAVPWEGALMACRNNPPYDLVTIEDNLENAAISSHVLESRAWIGLNDRAVEGTYVWADGRPLGAYESWAGGEPRGGAMGRLENCATMAARSPVWRDEACGVLDVSVGTDVGVFVCEAPVLP